MDQNKRNILLDILIKKISPQQLKHFIYIILGPLAFDDLSGNTHTEKCISFMSELYRRSEEHKLIEKIGSLKPDVDLSQFEREKKMSAEVAEPQPTGFLPFANRKEEWEKVVLYPTRQYYLFDGLAGYGKTALIKKIHKEFTDRGWFCAFVPSEEESGELLDLTRVFACLAQQLVIQPKIYMENPRRTSLEIGKTIAKERKDERGVAFLFDVDHAPREEFIPVLRTIVEIIIPSVWEGLMRNSKFFERTPKNYRVVITGRHLATRMRIFDISYNFDITQLKPFDYQVVQDICTQYVGEQLRSQEERDDFSAHLLFHSGGHPRCMTRILEKFKQQGYPPSDFFNFNREKLEEIAFEEISWVRHSIAPNLRQAFDSLCIYRRFDYPLLKKILEVPHLIWPGLAADEFDLAVKLKQSYLVDWTGESYQHLSDDITRRLLVKRRKEVDPDRFSYDCKQAMRFCTDRLANSYEHRPFWALEVLAEYLQAHTLEIDELKQRRKLRRDFFDIQLPSVLNLLIEGRDPRSQYESLRLVLAQDWDLQFTVNYYLRDNIYSNEPYKELLQRIDRFFAR